MGCSAAFGSEDANDVQKEIGTITRSGADRQLLRVCVSVGIATGTTNCGWKVLLWL